MPLNDLLVPTYRNMLQALSGWLAKAEAQRPAGAAEALLGTRLAPDMFPLSTQIRFACVQAYEGVHRLAGRPFPPIVDELLNEGRAAGTQPGSLADAQSRLAETIAFLDAAGEGSHIEPESASTRSAAATT